MTDHLSTAARILASFGAMALTLTLFVGTFAAPQTATFAGLLA